jgi:DNA repair protein RecN (Recombination protein N)
MLVELRIRNLGVIADLELVLGPGMTVVTGETGAGKTMLVEAIELLVGGRADGVLVRAGADQAWVEGRFEVGGDEVVLARAVPAEGRSRAYVDGRMAPASALADVGARLVDLHGQHTHQSLLRGGVQRAVLDAFGGIGHGPVRDARQRRRAVEAELAAMGGDQAARHREMDLLHYQLQELDGAALTGPDEDARLEAEEERLADAAGHRESAAAAYQALAGDGGAADAVGTALAHLARRPPLADLEARLRGLSAELTEAAADLRDLAESLEDDPSRLAEVRARRQLLRDLQRKYGSGPDGRGPASLEAVLAFADQARSRLAELEGQGQRAAALEQERARALAVLAAEEAALGAARRSAAPRLEEAVEQRLRELAMPKARFQVEVDDEDPGDVVTFLLGPNPGEPILPLAKAASGGELARAMLAVRLVLHHLPRRAAVDAPAGPARPEAPAVPPTMVFDEVDAGIGGEAALAVGRALAALARRADGDQAGQVLVVTHLPQVAAFADHHLAVGKSERGGRTEARAGLVEGDARLVEVSRMLSGQPASSVARRHAEELLAAAARERAS